MEGERERENVRENDRVREREVGGEEGSQKKGGRSERGERVAGTIHDVFSHEIFLQPELAKFVTLHFFAVAKTPGSRASAYAATKNIVQKMLKNVPNEVWNNLIRNRARVGVFARSETTCYYPEYARHRDTVQCR